MYKHKIASPFCSDVELMIRDSVRDFVEGEIMPVRQQIDDDEDHVIITGLLQKLADLGFLKGMFPEKYGGTGGMGSTLASMLATEEIARGDAGIAVVLGCCSWALAPAIMANNEAVLDYFAPMFCGDELKIGCFNMTEPGGMEGGGGCDIENLNLQGRKIMTEARLDGDEWVLNGQKIWASNSGIADCYCMVCTLCTRGREGALFREIREQGRDGRRSKYHDLPEQRPGTQELSCGRAG